MGPRLLQGGPAGPGPAGRPLQVHRRLPARGAGQGLPAQALPPRAGRRAGRWAACGSPPAHPCARLRGAAAELLDVYRAAVLQLQQTLAGSLTVATAALQYHLHEFQAGAARAAGAR